MEVFPFEAELAFSFVSAFNSVCAHRNMKISISASQKSPAHGFNLTNPIFIIRKSKRKFSRSPVFNNEMLQFLNKENFISLP